MPRSVKSVSPLLIITSPNKAANRREHRADPILHTQQPQSSVSFYLWPGDPNHNHTAGFLPWCLAPTLHQKMQHCQEKLPPPPGQPPACRCLTTPHPARKGWILFFLLPLIPGNVQGHFGWSLKASCSREGVPARGNEMVFKVPFNPNPFYDSTCMSALPFVWEKYIYLTLVSRDFQAVSAQQQK